MRLNHFVFVVLLFSAGCDNDGIGPVDIDPGNIWPLKTGNVWYYKVLHPTTFKDTLKMEITGAMTVSFGGQNYTVSKMAFYGLSEGLPEYQWLYWKGSDGVYLMGGVSPTDTFIVKELELKFPANIGDSWQYRSVAYSLNNKKFYISDTLTYSLIGKDVSIETSAGNFKCYVYQFSKRYYDDILAVYDFKYYYTPDVGHIRYTSAPQEHPTDFLDEYVFLNGQIN